MKIEQKDIDEQEALLASINKKLADAEAVLRFMYEKIGKPMKSVEADRKHLAIMMSGSTYGDIDLRTVGLEIASKPTLKDNIKLLVERMGHQEFTVQHIEALLQQDCNAPGGNNPRARIAMIMSDLEADGIVNRIFKGRGSEPHRFKKIKIKKTFKKKSFGMNGHD